jgi:hypothetical protein
MYGVSTKAAEGKDTALPSPKTKEKKQAAIISFHEPESEPPYLSSMPKLPSIHERPFRDFKVEEEVAVGEERCEVANEDEENGSDEESSGISQRKFFP